MRVSIRASLLAVVLGLPSAATAADPAAQPSSPSPAPPGASAEPPAPAQSLPQQPPGQDEEARKKLEAEIAKEMGASAAPPPAAAGQAQQPPAGGAPATGGNPMARLLLLPDISAIGSFAGAFDNYDVERTSPREGLFGPKDKPQPLFDELELGLQSVVDPYARADVFISFTPGGVDVEEAYLTTLALPGGLQLRAGKFFSPLGRQNQQHPHVWDFVDAPLARGRLVAAEVLSGPGIDLAWLAPLPWFVELHLAGQGTAPAPDDPERLTAVARLLQYFSFGEATTLGVGVSGARRSEATGAFRDLGAVDAYLRVRPPASRAYATLQGELYTRRFRNVEGDSGTGGYVQAFWRQDAYFGYGIRYDSAPAAGEAAPGREHRLGALATWFPSEFQRIRLQLSDDVRPGGRAGLEALLALELGIGSHGAHPF